MKYAGHTFKRVGGLAARKADPLRDKDHAGNPVPKDRFAIISRKTALKNPSGYVDADSILRAPILPGLFFPDGTDLIYGPFRKQERRGRFFWIPATSITWERNYDYKTIYQLKGVPTTVEGWKDVDGMNCGQVWFEEYWTCPVYVVKNGNVFRGSTYDWQPPAEETRMSSRHRT